MTASADNETEILLGNKQLLAVFGVVALLLAIAFTGGYMVGRNSVKKTDAIDTTTSAAPTTTAADAAHTHVVTPADQSAPPAADSSATHETTASDTLATRPSRTGEPRLGERKPKHVAAPQPEETPETSSEASAEGAPKPGQTFVQVAALKQAPAENLAHALQSQHFPARIAPAPSGSGMYRVLVGPLKDATDLSNTRDKLRKAGFTNVIRQTY
jgi:cell division septation protein DedD